MSKTVPSNYALVLATEIQTSSHGYARIDTDTDGPVLFIIRVNPWLNLRPSVLQKSVSDSSFRTTNRKGKRRKDETTKKTNTRQEH